MPDAVFCGDLEPHRPHKYTRTDNLFALADCPGRPEMPDTGKDAEEKDWHKVDGYWLGATPAVLIANREHRHFGPLTHAQADMLVDILNALQQQVTELEGKAALLKEVVDWSPHESWIRKRYAALTSPSTIAQKEMVQ